MRKIKSIFSLFLAMISLLAGVNTAGINPAPNSAAKSQAQTQAQVQAFDSAQFRRPAPDITLDVTDVIRVGAQGDDTMAMGNTIKRATPSGVPFISGTYANQAYAGETPEWPTIEFKSSEAVSNLTVTFSGANATTMLVGGSVSNSTWAKWEIRGGTANAGDLMVVSVNYTYTWNNQYTGVFVTDSYTTKGYAYVENIIFPAGVWAFASAYGQVKNAADVQYVSRIMGRGVYGDLLGQSSTSGDYQSGYHNFATNSFQSTTAGLPQRTMLKSDEPHKGAYDQYLANGTSPYADGDKHRAKTSVYLDSSVDSLEDNNVRMHFFIHGNHRSTNSGRDLTYETIHVRNGDVSYSGSTDNVLGASHTAALQALNPTGPVDGTVAEGGKFLYVGMETTSTLFGTGAAGSYTLITQWTAKGDNASSPNWMQYYHAVLVEIIRVSKGDLRNKLNQTSGVEIKDFNGLKNVTTVKTSNGADPENGGISQNVGKGKNPQSWYYSAGWNHFTSYQNDAWKMLNKPNASQAEVDNALNYLNGGYVSLVLAAANFEQASGQYLKTGLGNTYHLSTISPINTSLIAISEADYSFHENLRFWKEGSYDYFTPSSRQALESAISQAEDCLQTDYNLIYQPYVDYCAKVLDDAIKGLTLKANALIFNANGGLGSMAKQYIQAGSSQNINLNNFSKQGYRFTGWALEADEDVTYADGAAFSMKAEDVDLFAKWSPIRYTITYRGNGATGGATINSDHTYDSAKALNNNGYVRAGYDFVGWSYSAAATVPDFVDKEEIINLSNTHNATVTLYALWTPAEFSISFDANGGLGTMTSQKVKYLSSATLKENAFSMFGYDFAGWAKSKAEADNGLVSYTDQAVYDMNTPGDKTLHAVWSAGEYAVNFIKNGQDATGEMLPQTIVFGQSANLNLNDYTNPGYSFQGWALSDSGAKVYDDGAEFTMTTQGADLYAKWQANDYTVAFRANGGSGAPASMSATYGEDFTIPMTQPVRQGFDFVGWARTATAAEAEFLSGDSARNLTTVKNGTAQLYAVWVSDHTTTYKIEHYRESLAGNYELFETTNHRGETDDTAQAEYNDYLGFVPNPGHPSSVSTGVILGNGNLVLRIYYARFVSTINFDTAGGSAVAPINGKYDSRITLPTEPTRFGYNFLGWAPVLPIRFPATNLDVTARWSPISYNIMFNGNGATSGSTLMQSIPYGTTEKLHTNGFVRNGFDFVGWARSAEGQKLYDDGDDFTMDLAGTTLYALWAPSADTPYRVEHYTENISGNQFVLRETTTHYATTGETITIDWPDMPGFTPVTDHVDNLFTGTVMADGSLKLRLYYTRNSYTLTFAELPGSEPITAKFETIINPPQTNPSKYGFNFGGWIKAEEPDAAISWPYRMEALDRTLYPKWEPYVVIVAFDPVGGRINGVTGIQNSTAYFSLAYESGSLGFPTPVKTGYIFNGWLNPSDQWIYADTIVDVTSSHTLKASWTLGIYTVNFDLNGGVGEPPASVTNAYGTPVILPTSGYSSARPGYRFLGWNTSPTASTPLSSFGIPEGGATLYAVWEPRSYTVTFNLNGAEGKPPAALTEPVDTQIDLSAFSLYREGYFFIGWADSADAEITECLETYTVPPRNSVLYAVWLEDDGTLDLVAGDGTTTVINKREGLIYGLPPGTDEEAFLNQYTQVIGDAHLRITYHEDKFGTATKVELVDSSNLVVLRTFHVVIFGDVTGDGLVDETDFDLIKAVASFQTDFDGSKYFMLAADLNGDGAVDAFDYNLIKAIEKGLIVFDRIYL